MKNKILDLNELESIDTKKTRCRIALIDGIIYIKRKSFFNDKIKCYISKNLIEYIDDELIKSAPIFNNLTIEYVDDEKNNIFLNQELENYDFIIEENNDKYNMRSLTIVKTENLSIEKVNEFKEKLKYNITINE